LQNNNLPILTTEQLAKTLAGGDSYIRTKGGKVKGLAVNTIKNPEAPDVIIIGTGPRKIANAKLLLATEEYLPVYVKQAVNAWKYLGEYRSERYSQEPKVIEAFRKNRDIAKIDGIMFLSPKPTSETKKKQPASDEAINKVTLFYQQQGFVVTDKQQDNLGFDLLAEKGKKVLKLVVKEGCLAETLNVLTQSEKAKSADPLWRLVLVKDNEQKILKADELADLK